MGVRKISNFENMNMLYIIFKARDLEIQLMLCFREMIKFRENTSKTNFLLFSVKLNSHANCVFFWKRIAKTWC